MNDQPVEIPPLEIRAQLLAAAAVSGNGLKNGAVGFIMRARAIINELLAELRRIRNLSVANEEDSLP